MSGNRIYRLRIYAVVASVIFHLIVLFPFLIELVVSNSLEKENTANLPVSVSVSLLNISDKTTISYSGEGINVSSESDKLICENADKEYVGIGILHGLRGTDLVLYAPMFYPAYRAGIRQGDQILFLERRGQFMYITVLRDDVELNFMIKMEKICFR